jgi:putative oxidoreductase
MSILVVMLIGRLLFSLIFIFYGITQLINYKDTVKLMSTSKVPFPKFSAISSSLMALIGGIGIAFYAYSLYGSILIILFLLPATYYGHKFWSIKDKKEKANQMQHFIKNISLIGGAIIIGLITLW